jgi:hypothetical protein
MISRERDPYRTLTVRQRERLLFAVSFKALSHSAANPAGSGLTLKRAAAASRSGLERGPQPYARGA